MRIKVVFLILTIMILSNLVYLGKSNTKPPADADRIYGTKVDKISETYSPNDFYWEAFHAEQYFQQHIVPVADLFASP